MKKPSARVLYLGAASGTTVSHVSDIVGPVSDLYKIVVYFYLLGLLELSKKIYIYIYIGSLRLPSK